MPMNEGYSPIPSAKKKLKPGVAKRVSDRNAFVSEKTGAKGITNKQANQRFFVQTRMAEMKAKGKTVTPEMRKQLQQKFQSGDVARKGFAAPAKKTGGSGSSSSAVSKVTPKVTSRTDSSGRSGMGATAPRSMPSANDREGRGGSRYATAPKGRSATSNMQGIRGYGRVDSKGRTGFGATSQKRQSGLAAANPRTAKLVGGIVGGLKSVGSAINNSRNDPSRVSMSAAANRAAKAKADAAKKKK
jgi:hypothetical protein